MANTRTCMLSYFLFSRSYSSKIFPTKLPLIPAVHPAHAKLLAPGQRSEDGCGRNLETIANANGNDYGINPTQYTHPKIKQS